MLLPSQMSAPLLVGARGQDSAGGGTLTIGPARIQEQLLDPSRRPLSWIEFQAFLPQRILETPGHFWIRFETELSYWVRR